MERQFITTNEAHNRRIVDVLVEKVTSNCMSEKTALEIARDSWKSISGVFTFEDKRQLDSMWANSLCKTFSLAS